MPYPTAGQRVDYLRHVTEYMAEHAPDVPILIAGNGDRVLTIAAQRADIIGLTGGGPAGADVDPLADRIAFVRDAARRALRRTGAEHLRSPPCRSTASGVPDLSTRPKVPARPVRRARCCAPRRCCRARRATSPTRIRGYRDNYGVTYIIVQQQHGEAFAKVIAELR